MSLSPSRPFILRPVATSLLMAAILLAGVVAYLQLPVSALPEVDYPIIQVLTFYPGASPEVMASSVTAPLERQFGQMPGLKQMTSISSGGGSVITLQFNLDENIDVAEQEVQAAINAANTFLPTDLPNPPIYSKVNPADAPILTLALTSDTLPLDKIEDAADTNLAQKISQVTGVGLVTIAGGQKPAVRIQANPAQLASYDLSLEDLRTAVAAANVDQAKGTLNGARQSYTIGANDQLLIERGLQAGHRRLSQRRAGPRLRRGHRRRCRRKLAAGRLDESPARGHRQHPAPARRQHHRRRRPHQASCCRSLQTSLPASRSGPASSPTAPSPSAPRSRTWNSSSCSPSPWW